MIVKLIAHTVVTGWGDMRDTGWVDYPEEIDGETWDAFENFADADYLAEFAGRLCYQSWERPNPATATNVGYLANILDVKHTSVLEHSSATFLVREVSRSLLDELRTHRHLSFSALSQRYVNENDANVVYPPAFTEDEEHELNTLMPYVRRRYADIVHMLLERGLTRKQAREAARSVLPMATETQFVVTGNMWAWHYVLGRRVAASADAEMQLVAKEMLRQLKEIAPNTFQDMKDE